MKILYVCHRFPFPPKRGGKIRPFNMIRHLHASHEVTVASIARSQAEAEEGRDHDLEDLALERIVGIRHGVLRREDAFGAGKSHVARHGSSDTFGRAT